MVPVAVREGQFSLHHLPDSCSVLEASDSAWYPVPRSIRKPFHVWCVIAKVMSTGPVAIKSESELRDSKFVYRTWKNEVKSLKYKDNTWNLACSLNETAWWQDLYLRTLKPLVILTLRIE